MAAKRSPSSLQTNVESVVNRWVVDYYLYLALELYKNDRYADFCDIRDIIQSMFARPVASTDIMGTKILVLQLLSRINDGEKLDSSFESDHSVSPLESALMLLERMSQECSIPEQDFDNVCMSVKEMIVRIFIKNSEFDKAKEALIKHFPKRMTGKTAIFMGLISRQTKTHDIIEHIDFQQFKEEVLAFCLKLCPFTVPFLHKAANQLIDRLKEQGSESSGPEEQEEPGLSTSNINHFSSCKRPIIQRTFLEAAYNDLAAGLNVRTFAQLEEEVKSTEKTETRKDNLSLHLSPAPKTLTSQVSEQDGLFQRDSGSPMEASPADHRSQTDAVPQAQAGSCSKTTLRKRQLYTVSRLVVNPDSEEGSQCTSSQEPGAEVSIEDAEQPEPTTSKEGQQKPDIDTEGTTLTQKRPRQDTKACTRSSTLTSKAAVPADSEEKAPRSVASGTRSRKAAESSSDSERDTRESLSHRTPVRKGRQKNTSSPPSRDNTDTDEMQIIDSSVDSSPNLFPLRTALRRMSTPHKDPAEDTRPTHSKWKTLLKNAKESKEQWTEEESLFKSSKGTLNESSNSGQRKRWTEEETKKLKQGVEKFGEGNWSKIRSHYSFDRTNVNLKDRWRTMKKSNMV